MVAATRLTIAQERALIRRWQTKHDGSALCRLVMSLRWLIEHHARRLQQFDQSRDDLIQEGELGAILAIDRFDLARTTKLSTYAIHWILAQMMQYVMQNRRIVRLPMTSRTRKDFFALARARSELAGEGRPQTAEALARRLAMSEARVEMLSGPLGRDFSLDVAPPNDARALGDRLTDPQPGPEDLVLDAEEKAHLSEHLEQGLARLSPRERFIVSKRWLGEEIVPLAAVGRTLGISRERVRQIERSAQKKLRRAIAR